MKLTEENIAEYADTLVLQVRAGGVLGAAADAEARALNYSSESLAVLERLLSVSDELFALPNFPEMQRNLVVFYVGCYVGETIARNLRGIWSFSENWFDSTLTCAPANRVGDVNTGGVQVRPFQKVHRRITEAKDENNLVAYFEGLQQQLLSLRA